MPASLNPFLYTSTFDTHHSILILLPFVTFIVPKKPIACIALHPPERTPERRALFESRRQRR